jgi:hypothetical protein
MKKQLSAALALLFAGLAAAQVHAQQPQPEATTNMPARAGEASTMTNGVPNLVTSNVQPGELGIQSRLTVRKAAPPPLPAYGGDPALKLMGGPGPMRPVLIAPPGTP